MATENRHLYLASGALRVPETQNLSSVKLWCEYAIWGLLFHDDQSPWLTLVEAMHICFDRHRHNKPIFAGLAGASNAPEHEQVEYTQTLNTALRHLLFRDREVLRIADRSAADSASMWKAWYDTVARDYESLELGYLEREFNSFRDFARAVELLRSAEIESHTDKRWTSRHILPLGPAMLFPDVNQQYKLDRKFMRRTGEMLYLMLNRSNEHAKVASLLTDRLLGVNTTWNKLATRLRGHDDAQINTANIGYLPMAHHDTYDLLAKDWLALLSLDSIPIENLLDSLQRIGGLIQAIYIIERAYDVMGEDAPPRSPFFLDIVGASGNNPIRKLSTNQYKHHKTLPLSATIAFLDAFIASQEWAETLISEAGAQEANALLKKRFRWSPKRTPDPDRLPDPTAQMTELASEAQTTRGHHIGATFTNHVRQIGLLRAQRSSGTWYAPTDAFLEALVLTNVTTPLEYSEFLQKLMDKYNIVVGPEEVRVAFGVRSNALPAPLADLKENERRLEDRLRILGFLERKSDDCAFVINPFLATQGARGVSTSVDA